MAEKSGKHASQDDVDRFRTVMGALAESTSDLRSFVLEPEFCKVFDEYISTDAATHGNSLLDLKLHLLMQYLSNITTVGMMKVCPPYSLQPSQELILNSAKIRTALEKIRPMEQKLKYQLDKLMRMSNDAAAGGTGKDVDPLSFKPNPEGLTAGGGEDQEGSTDGSGSDDDEDLDQPVSKSRKYVPPKLTSMQYFDTTRHAREERVEKSKKDFISKGILQDLKDEIGDEPVEVRQLGDELGDKVRRKYLQKRHEKERFEEDNMVRLNKTKKEKSMDKRAERMFGAGEFSGLSDFRDIEKLINQERGSGKKKKAVRGKKRKRIRI